MDRNIRMTSLYWCQYFCKFYFNFFLICEIHVYFKTGAINMLMFEVNWRWLYFNAPEQVLMQLVI